MASKRRARPLHLNAREAQARADGRLGLVCRPVKDVPKDASYAILNEDPHSDKPSVWVSIYEGGEFPRGVDPWFAPSYRPGDVVALVNESGETIAHDTVKSVRCVRVKKVDDYDDVVAMGFKEKWTCVNPGTGSYAVANNIYDDFKADWTARQSKYHPWDTAWAWCIELEAANTKGE